VGRFLANQAGKAKTPPRANRVRKLPRDEAGGGGGGSSEGEGGQLLEPRRHEAGDAHLERDVAEPRGHAPLLDRQQPERQQRGAVEHRPGQAQAQAQAQAQG
jgi:hypothetical protein